MSLWVDTKYAGLIGPRFQLFKVKKASPYTANFRCYVCGDSQKNRFKARGYFFTKGQGVFYTCKNCGVTKKLSTVLNELDEQMFNDYRLEKLSNDPFAAIEKTEKQKDPITERPRPSFESSKVLEGAKRISALDIDHGAVKYVRRRRIPASKHYLLYYVPKFAKWVNEHYPPNQPKLNAERDEPRLIIPFISEDGKEVFGFQGRAFHNNGIRYMTIMLDDRPKIYGLERISRTKMVNVVEGPIDSLFLDNCVAMAGSDADLRSLGNPSNVRVIYDNEPRNKEVVSKVERAIKLGYNVVIWPGSVSAKDINDLAKEKDWSQEDLMKFIADNTYSGLSASIQFVNWKKV